MRAPRFWIGVACKEHVANGVEQGFCQFCHGKASPAKRLSQGDYIIYYSSKVQMDSSVPYQRFTAVGTISDDEAYQVEQFPGFKPFRRNVTYFRGAKHTDIRPLVPVLDFIKNKSSWGQTFRFGFLEIDAQSFDVIAQEMLGHNPAAVGEGISQDCLEQVSRAPKRVKTT